MNFNRVTDTQGRLVIDDSTEPEPSSIVLVHGEFGNAWQRYFSDGLWHRGKETKVWSQLIRERNVLLVYDAPKRAVQVEVLGVLTGRIEG